MAEYWSDEWAPTTRSYVPESPITRLRNAEQHLAKGEPLLAIAEALTGLLSREMSRP